MIRVPRQLTASALILLRDRRLVLLFHEKLGVYLYPGGHVEPDETPDEAIKREVLEETGLEVTLLGAVDRELNDEASGVFSLATPYLSLCERINDPKQTHDHIDLVYACIVTDERTAPLDGLICISAEHVDSLKTFPAFRRLLHKVFSDQSLWRLADERRAIGVNSRSMTGALT